MSIIIVVICLCPNKVNEMNVDVLKKNTAVKIHTD